MNRKVSFLTALVLVLTTLLVPVMANAAEPVKIGAIAPLSGGLAMYGESTTNGIKLAIQEINEAGGVLGGRPLEVIDYMDDKADSTEGANAFNKLVSDGVVAIIGSVTSGVTSGLATLADQESMLLLTPTATADTVTEGVKGVFRACYKDSFQSDVAARVPGKLGITKVAILYASGDAYSAGMADGFRAAAEKYGLEIVATESSSSTDDTDFTTQLTNIKASGAELIFAPYYYNAIGPYIVPQAREIGYEGYFVGADGWDGLESTMKEDKSLYNKCIFTNHYAADDPSEVVQNFVAKYKATFDPASLTALAALGYDAAYLLKDAIEAAGTDDTAAIIAAMPGLTFSGVTGTFTLDETGNSNKGATALEYVDGVPTFFAAFSE